MAALAGLTTTELLRLRKVSEALRSSSTEELTRLRVWLAKYSEDEPRDPHGRWTAGGADDPGPAATRFTGIRGAQVIRNELQNGQSEDGETLLRHIAQAEPNAPRLYRGITLSSPQAVTRQFGAPWKPTRNPYPDSRYNWGYDEQGRHIGTAKPEYADRMKPEFHTIEWVSRMPPEGSPQVSAPKAIDLNLSSWSTTERVASGFAERGGGVPVTLQLSEGARALDVSGHSFFQDLDAENEWVTAGHFQVDSVVRNYGRPGYTVSLTQTGVFTSPAQAVGSKVIESDIAKYSEDQPRDDHGRFASSGTYDEVASRHLPDLSPQEMDAVMHYQYSTEVNSYLRGYASGYRGVRNEVKALDAAIAKAKPLDAPLVVYRGMAGLRVDEARGRMASLASRFDGKTGFSDKAYVSTTQSLDKAKDFARWYRQDEGGKAFVVELHIPAGTRALPVDAISSEYGAMGNRYWPGSKDEYGSPVERFDLNGQEWLLPRGSSWEPKGMNEGRAVYELRP